jgi:hypothetical protein
VARDGEVAQLPGPLGARHVPGTHVELGQGGALDQREPPLLAEGGNLDEGEGLAGGHVELLGAGAEGVAAAAGSLPLLVQLAAQRPLGGRGPEPGPPDQVADEEQPDQPHGQQDFPGGTDSLSHGPIHSSRYRRRV